MATTRVRGVNILVLDGDADFAQTVAAAFGRQPEVNAVESTTRVVEALRTLRAETVDAVVCGRVNGGWPVSRLREEDNLPVVALVDDADAADCAVEAGATDYFLRTTNDGQWSLVAERLHELIRNRHAVESYRELFDVAGDSITIHDPETGEMLDANRQLVELLGYDRDRLLAGGVELMSDQSQGFDGERAQEVVRAAAAGEEPEPVEWALETVDGETVWVEATLEVGDIGGERRVISVSRDITERKRLQEELAESERRFRQIAERIDQIVYLTNGDLSEVLYVNPAYEDVFGRSTDELYEDSFAFLDGVHPDDRDEYLTDIESMLDDVARGDPDDTYEFRFRVQRPDGTVRHVHAVGYPIRGEDRFVGVTEDVTERRRREREREELFESVSDGLVVHDPKTGEMLDVNEQFCELTGYDREELIGENVGLVVAEDAGYTYERARERIERAREEGPQLFEWREERKDGQQYPVEVHLDVAMVDGEERVLASVRDITERKRRERELEETERRFRRITENVDEVVFNTYGVVSIPDRVYDDPPEEARIDYLSPAFEDLWGRPVEEAYENPRVFFEGIHPDDRDAFVDTTQRMARDELEGAAEESYDVEFRVVQPDGQVRWASASAYPVELSGVEPFYWVGIIKDVTEERRRERRLQQIAERVDEVIHMTSPDLEETLYVSPGYEDLWGRSVDELDDDPLAFLQYVHADDRPAVRDRFETIRDVAAGRETGDGPNRAESHRDEYRIERPGGEIRWLETTGYPLADAEGQVYRYITLSRDITEEKSREAVLEDIHDATRQLTEADSAAAACETAVRAATDLLGFEVVVAYRYDDGSGRLQPVATSSDADAVDPVLPGENRAWQVFVGGNAAGVDANGDSASVLPGAEDEIVLPLGEHGVFAVGDERLDTDDFEAAQILAARLEAGLNHVEGRREVRERERDLREQTERADRLARLNAVIRDVEAAVVEESTRDGIERSVCRRLVDGDAYELAWVGEFDVAGGSLTVRNRAGDDGHGVPVDVVVDESPPESHPALLAAETGEFQYVESIVAADSDQWRRQALTRGYQSCCAVPLSHDDRVWGVLVLYAAEPDAFEERERQILGELGRTIGYAITTIERRRALESDSTVELELAVSDSGLYVVEFAKLTGRSVRHKRTVRRADGSVSLFCRVEGDSAVVDMLADARSVDDVSTVSEGDEHVLVEATADTWFGEFFAEHGAVVRSASADDEGGRVVVDSPQTANVRAIVEQFRDAFPGTELVAKRETEGRGRSLPELQEALERRLTDRQREALETAFSTGYFEWPRESSGEDVAERLDITQPTFNRHLRIAEAETFSLVLDADGADEDG